MNSSLLMDFSLDKENHTILIKREFLANQDLVWATWSQAELLDQWWAPLPWKSKTKKMNFTEGGMRLYAMLGPEGEEHWALAEYYIISPKNNIKYLDGFCDLDGVINPNFPRADWDIVFTEVIDRTTIHISIKHNSREDLEQIIEMGFKEGFTLALDHLETLLTTHTNQK